MSFLLMKLLKRIENEDEHLRGIIIVRGKDNDNPSSKVGILRRYTFNSYEDYLKDEDEIKILCDTFGGRFYINPTVKSYRSIAYEMLEGLAKDLKSANFKHIKRLYDSVADANVGIHDKKLWVVDIDKMKEPSDVMAYVSYFTKLNLYVDYTDTKNGCHLLVKPHQVDLDALEKLRLELGTEEVTIKKNALTLIYWGGKKE